MPASVNPRPRSDQSLDAWAEEFYSAARSTGRLFRSSDKGLVYVGSGDALYLAGVQDFVGIVNNAADILKATETDDNRGQVEGGGFIDAAGARFLYYSSCRSLLDKADFVFSDTRVILTPSGPKLTKPGHSSIGPISYYQFPAILGDELQPLQTTHHLEECFSCIPFTKPGYRSNLLAWMLGGLVLDLCHPILVVNGNGQKVGKTATVDAAGWVLEGKEPGRNDTRKDELMKGVGARFRRGEKLIFFDNLVSRRAFDNPQLSSLITATGSQEVRILGTNDLVSSRGAMFVFTVNNAKLATDITERALAVNLYREVFEPMAVFPPIYAAKYRRQLYGELLGLALRQPAETYTSAPGFRFRTWLDFVGPRVEPVFGPLMLTDATEFDAVSQELFSWGERNREAFTPASIMEAILSGSSAESAYPQLREILASINSERGRQTKIGIYLRGLVDRSYSPVPGMVIKLVRTQGRQGAIYQFLLNPSGAPVSNVE